MEFIQALQEEIVFWQKVIERHANVAPPQVVERMVHRACWPNVACDS